MNSLRLRYSLLTLLLCVIAVSSGIALWFRWEAWGIAYRIGNASEIPCFSKDGRFMVVSNDLGKPSAQYRAIDALTGNECFVISGRVARVTCVTFSTDGELLAAGYAFPDNSVGIWNMLTGKEVHVLKGQTRPLYCVVFSPVARTLVTSSCDGNVRVWNVELEKEILKREVGIMHLDDESLSADGRLLTLNDGWGLDLQTGDRCAVDSKPPFAIPASHHILATSCTAELTASGNDVYVWDPIGLKCKGILPGANRSYDPNRERLKMSSLGDYVISNNVDDPNATVLWCVASGLSRRLENQHILRFSPDDQWMFTIEPGKSTITAWSRRRPEGRWGVLALPELWLAILAGALLLVRLARRVLARKAA